jgi:hypothetical protein
MRRKRRARGASFGECGDEKAERERETFISSLQNRQNRHGVEQSAI